MWGFISSSPLVFGQVVIVHAGGAGDKGTLAFDVATANSDGPLPGGNDTYASPQLAKYGKRNCSDALEPGLGIHQPATGATRFSYAWKHSNYRALQPQFVSRTRCCFQPGWRRSRLIRLARNGEAITAREVWTSRHLKPDFNDSCPIRIMPNGFDNNIFTCIRLATGERAWKGGRYGKGQVLLLADSELLFVMGERGEGVPSAPRPRARELAMFPLLNGKTWNHPAIVATGCSCATRRSGLYRLPLLKESP